MVKGMTSFPDGAVSSRYNDLTHDELVRLLEARDRRDSTRFGLVWEANKIPVQRRTLDVFTSEIQTEFNFAADLSPTRAAILAQKALLANKTFDPRELRHALLRKVEAVMREEAMSEADDAEKVAHFLDVILATHPHLLHEAQKAAINQHAEIQEAAELPPEIDWPEPLASSARNVYGVMPANMNTWEVPFAELLDRDANNVVMW
jgi:hypothetical protein